MAGGFSDNFYETLFSIIDNRNEYEIPEQQDYGLMENMQNDEEIVSSDEYDSLLRELEVLKQMQSQEQQNDVEDFAPETNEYESDLSFLLQDIGSYEGNTGVINMVASTLKTKDDSVNISKTDDRLLKYLNSLPENVKSSILVTSGNDYDGHENNSKHYSNKALDLRYVPQLHDYIKNDPTAKALGINVLNPNHGTAPHTHIQIRQNGGSQTGSKSTTQLPNVKVVTRKPLVVTNPNDPRLKAYQDSLFVYNQGESRYNDPKRTNKVNRPSDGKNWPTPGPDMWPVKIGTVPISQYTYDSPWGGKGLMGARFARPVRPVILQQDADKRKNQLSEKTSNWKRLPNGDIINSDNQQLNVGSPIIPQYIEGNPLNIEPIRDGEWSVTQGRGTNTQSTRKFNNKAEFDAFLEAQRSVDNIPMTTTYEGSKNGSALFNRFKYAEGGSVNPDPNKSNNSLLDKLGTLLNPMNWGVKNYNDVQDFNAAYTTARNNGKKEFIWNNKRYSTRYNGSLQDQLKNTGIVDNRIGIQGNMERRAFTTIKPSIYDDGSVGQNIRNFISNNNRFDDVKYKNLTNELLKADSAGDIEKSKKILLQLDKENANYKGLDDPYSEDGWRMYLGIPQKSNTFSVSKYQPNKSKEVSTSYYALPEAFKEELYNLYKNKQITNGVNNEFSFENFFGESQSRARVLGNFTVDSGTDDRGEYISYYDKYDLSPKLPVIGKIGLSNIVGKPFEIYDRIYMKDYGNGLKKRMYYSDRELLSMTSNKKDFDTLALQKELSNRGYDLSSSIKNNGNFDGIFGDDTRKALEDWQSKNAISSRGTLRNGPPKNSKSLENRFKTGGKYKI